MSPTLAQQYLLRQWYVRDDRNAACDANLAARPGASNHNDGLAVDISDSSVWREAIANARRRHRHRALV